MLQFKPVTAVVVATSRALDSIAPLTAHSRNSTDEFGSFYRGPIRLAIHANLYIAVLGRANGCRAGEPTVLVGVHDLWLLQR